MSIPLATVATLFLERQGLARSTVQSYELSLMPLLGEYGSYPIEVLSRRALADYQGQLTSSSLHDSSTTSSNLTSSIQLRRRARLLES